MSVCLSESVSVCVSVGEHVYEKRGGGVGGGEDGERQSACARRVRKSPIRTRDTNYKKMASIREKLTAFSPGNIR